MQDNDFLFPKNIYKKYLSVIRGVKFTPREIDVIACFAHAQGVKKTAALLSISGNTVWTHDRNVMSKVGCNSRQGIIDFVEQSPQLPLLKKHYAALAIYSAFEKIVKNVAKKNKAQVDPYFIIYKKDQGDKNAFIDHLKNHLKQAGFRNLVCEEIESIKIESLKDKDKALFLILEESDREKISNKLSEVVDVIDVSGQSNYYLAVFEILKKLLPDVNLKTLLANFIEQIEGMGNFSESQFFNDIKSEGLERKEGQMVYKKFQFLQYKKWYFLFAIFCISSLALFLGLRTFKGAHEVQKAQDREEIKEPPIRSDLTVPTHFVLLHRPELLTQIDKKFEEEKNTKNRNEPQAIALVGPGGAGKTILARQYAHQQKARVIWEINAETTETLQSSFEELAQALAQTEEDQKILTGLQELKNSTIREKKLIGFVKKRIRSYSDWLIIYDNVREFQDIQKYFPQDAETWGRGKIILATRNSNIQNHKYVGRTIQVGELDSEQKLNLFIKIMTNGEAQLFTQIQKEEAKQFLENIPPYPLDISIAAYYLKTANISYNTYLEEISKNNNNFTNVQEKILKEVGDYTKTRYEIIGLTLKQLMEINPDFGELLLFMSMLASNPIPRDLLDSYKNKIVVDDFIYNLKRYSLVKEEKFSSTPVGQTLSLHQCTQDVSLDYLTKALNLHKNKKLIQIISNTLKNYVSDAIDKDDLDRMKLLITHCEWLLKNPDLLDHKEKEVIGGELGGLYFYVKNYPKAQQVLEEALHKVTHDPRSASIFVYLSLVYRDLAEYKKAKYLLEKSLAFYQQNDPENHLRIAQVLAYLGRLEGDMFHYEKSRELLEQSLAIHKRYDQEDSLHMAWVLTSLANVYRELSEYKKAKELLEQSLSIYKKRYPQNHVRTAWALALLGNVHRSLGQYNKAKDLLEESLGMYKKNYPENHISIAWVSTHLGNTYRKLGYYDKAKQLLEQSHYTYTNYFSDNHVANAWVLTHLGNIYKESGDNVKAKETLEKGHHIYQTYDLGTLWSGAHLGNFYREQGNFEKAKALLEQSYRIYQEHPAEKDVRLAMFLKYLGNLSRDLREFEKAKTALQKSRTLYSEICGENHIETARVLHDLGKTYFLEGDLKEAESLLRNALTIMEQTQSPDAYRVLETLSDLEIKKAAEEEAKGNMPQAEIHKSQAAAYIKKALDAVKAHFPEDSPHIPERRLKLTRLRP